jgi:hypothetical protein
MRRGRTLAARRSCALRSFRPLSFHDGQLLTSQLASARDTYSPCQGGLVSGAFTTHLEALGAVGPAPVAPGPSFGACKTIIGSTAYDGSLAAFPNRRGARLCFAGFALGRGFLSRAGRVLGHYGRVEQDTPSRGSMGGKN